MRAPGSQRLNGRRDPCCGGAGRRWIAGPGASGASPGASEARPWRLHHGDRDLVWTARLVAWAVRLVPWAVHLVAVLVSVEQGGQARLELGAAKGAIVTRAARDGDRLARHQHLVALGRLRVQLGPQRSQAGLVTLRVGR